MAAPPKIKLANNIDKKKLDVFSKTPPELRQKEIHQEPLEKGLDLPNGIHINNIDDSFVAFIDKVLSITANGERIPVYMYSQDRYFEVSQQWMNSDSTDTPSLPFVAITREPLVKKGNMLGGTHNIPTNEKFPLKREITVRDGKTYVEVYSISQPIHLDMEYSVGIFTTKLYDTDKFNEKKLELFQSRQSYIQVLGHYMPVILEEENDKTVTDIEQRRFYHHQLKMKVMGYLIQEQSHDKSVAVAQFEVKTQVEEKSWCGMSVEKFGQCGVSYVYLFPRKNHTPLESVLPEDITFTSSNLNGGFEVTINGVLVGFPFTARKGDKMVVSLTQEPTKNIKLKIYGDSILL